MSLKLPHLKLPNLTLLALFTRLLPAQTPLHHPTTLALGAEYSNTSSHIILGSSNNRRLTGLDLTLSTRLTRNRVFVWTYDIELRPFELLQDPVSRTTLTFTPPNSPPLVPFPIQSGPIQGACTSAVLPNPPGIASNVPITETRTCGTRWTYAGGLSPLGQRFNFRPAHRLQPYALLNAGFLVSPRDIPSYNSSRFNFTFAFGAGLQFAQTSNHAWSLDYRIHHLSNRAIGNTNPGVDNQLFRLSYTFGSFHPHRF